MSSHFDKETKSFVDSMFVCEDFAHIWINFDNVFASTIALSILAAYASLHFGKIIFRTKVIWFFVILLHNFVARVVLRGAH